ncbi:hypothetical protein O9993_05670 [Vibrio lentus]|nr:hypothetical protein [Vibrio lentus]
MGAKDATETTEENTVLNGNVPAATDVDGTVESYQLVDDVTEGSLTFNDDGSRGTFTQAATLRLPPGQDRDVTSLHRDRQRHRRERAEDHHHYRDGQQRRASAAKDATETTEEKHGN